MFYLEVELSMHTVIMTLLLIVSLGLIILVLLQSSKSEGLSALSGGAEQLFGKQKARGMDLILARITVVLAVLFFVLAIAIAKI